MKYIIGIDGGSQSTKVVIFDTEGHVVAEAHEPLKPLLLPKEGVALHPDDDLWTSLGLACRRALSRFPGRPGDLIGAGLCTIRCCRTILKNDGTLAHPVFSWMDLRLARPYEHVFPDVAHVTTTSGYITHRLTGRRRDTAANYAGEWPIDNLAWDWSPDPEIIRRFNLPRTMLFDLVMPGAILGTVTKAAAEATGLPEGLPVAATASDKAVEALGTGALDEETALVSLGTYITSMVEGAEFTDTAGTYWTNLACRPHRYLYESGGIRRGMSTVTWVRELMGEGVVRRAGEAGLTPDDYLGRLAAEIPAGSEGLMTVPDWLAPASALYKRGLMIGFTGRHSGVHMYRSVMEAIALTMKGHCLAMAGELDRRLKRLIISGGGSNGDLFMQIFADVFNLPASRTEINGAVSLGSAICAAVGTGFYGSFEEAMARMIRPRDTFRPVPAQAEVYDRLDEVYKQISGHTDEILKKSYAVFN